MNDRLFIFDTTLRDGEQSPGCSMDIKEKIEERYPDDFVGRAVSYLTVVIDGKKVMKHLG